MALTIFQISIREKKASWFRGTSQWIGQLPLASKIVAGGAVVGIGGLLAPVEGAVAVAGVATAVLGAGLVAIFDQDQQMPVQITDPKQLAKFKTIDDQPFSQGSFYAVHPKAQTTLILTSEFHRLIAMEQVSELIAYIRSKLAVRYIKIEVLRRKGGTAGVKSPSEGEATVSAGIHFSDNHNLIVESHYDDLAIHPMINRPVWLSSFPAIVNSINGAKKGRHKFLEKQDASFGLKIDFAKRVGIDGSWIGEQNFQVEIDYG